MSDRTTNRIVFVTGTDTGVGKTVVATLLTRELRVRGVRAAALKPLCTGGRQDARQLWEASERVLSLNEVNPWHFPTPLAPVLAARKERRKVFLREVVTQIRVLSRRFACVVVEGAGGLLSPLGEDFDSRDLVRALGAAPVIVAPNRLGAVNQVRLVLAALPPRMIVRTQVVLVRRRWRDLAARTNSNLLSEYLPRERIHELPWLKDPLVWMRRLPPLARSRSGPRSVSEDALRRALRRLLRNIGVS